MPKIYELIYSMRKLHIMTLCLSAGLASGFAGVRGDGVWIQTSFQVNAQDLDFSRGSAVYESPLSQPSFGALSQSELDDPFCDTAQFLVATGPVFHDRLDHRNAAGIPTRSAPKTPTKLGELDAAHSPTLAQASLSESATTFLTGAGAIGLLLFGALVHPRRLTVLCIGK